MKKSSLPSYVYKPGDHLKKFIKVASFGGLFFSLFGTLLIGAGTESFDLPSIVWQVSFVINLIMFFAVWIVYLQFRGTDKLLGHGIISFFILFSFFWIFGVAMFYFYFIFAPINYLLQTGVLASVSVLLLYRLYIICNDITTAFIRDKTLCEKMYREEGGHIQFSREAVGYLEAARPERNPFKSVHAFAAIAIAPFVLILNRVLTPITGEGHGVFMVLAFFSVPMMLWGAGIVAQTVVSMIYLPISIRRKTGKEVLIKDW